MHKRDELIRKARHGASNADSADIRTSANPAHPASLSHVALHHRPPTSQLDNAKRRSVFIGKLRLLIEATAVTTLVYRVAKKPGRSQCLVERNHRRPSRRYVKQIQKRFHEIVGLHRTAGHAHDGNLRLRLPLPSQVVRKPHASRWIAFHGVNAAVGGAGSRRHHRPRTRRETVDPFTGGDRLAGLWVGAQGSPVTYFLIVFVRDRPFYHQNEVFHLPFSGLMERLHIVVAVSQREEGIVQSYLWNPGNLPEENVFNTGLGGRGHGSGVPVAAQPGGDPQYIELGNHALLRGRERHPLLRGRHHMPSVPEEKVPLPGLRHRPSGPRLL